MRHVSLNARIWSIRIIVGVLIFVCGAGVGAWVGTLYLYYQIQTGQRSPYRPWLEVQPVPPQGQMLD